VTAVPALGNHIGSAVAVTGMPLQIDIGDLFFVLLFFFLGLYLVYKGFDEYRASRLIRDTATETVRSVAAGRTELTGTAKPDDTLFHRPFSDGECLYANYRIREKRDKSGQEGSEWTTVDSDTWVTPFYLDDETGEIRVEPEAMAKFEISDEHTTTVTVGSGQREPPEIREFLEEVSSASSGSRKRRYIEKVIPPEESVYVLGGAEQRETEEGANEDRLAIRRDGGSDRLIISDMSEGKLTSTLTYRAPMLILIGLVVSAGCLYALLQMFGVG